jgi:hypothetical protein
MKNFKFISLVLTAVIIGLAGCKRKDDPTPDNKTCVLTQATVDGYKLTFEYDSQGRHVKTNYYEGTTIDEYVQVTYKSNTQVEVKWFSAGDPQPAETIVYTLNNGMAISSVSSDTYTIGGFSYTSTQTTTYERNSDGYLSKETESTVLTTNKPGVQAQTTTSNTIYNYSGGNLSSKSYTSANSASTTTYEYYMDKPESGLSLGLESGFLATKPNKNLLKKETEVYTHQGSSYTYIYNYTYEFNPSGLITKMIQNGGQSGQASTTSTTLLEHSCN